MLFRVELVLESGQSVFFGLLLLRELVNPIFVGLFTGFMVLQPLKDDGFLFNEGSRLDGLSVLTFKRIYIQFISSYYGRWDGQR